MRSTSAVVPAIFCALGLLLVASRPVHAAEVAITKGTKALLFRIDGLSQVVLSGFEGGVGLRWYLKDKLAFRPGADFTWSYIRIRPGAVPPGQPAPTDETRNDTSVSLHLALEKHFGNIRSVSPYVGGMLRGVYINNKTKPHWIRYLPNQNTKVTYKESDGGALGILGFEWAWTPSLSLGGEYRAGLQVITHKEEWEYTTEPDQLRNDTVQYTFGFSTAALYLAVTL
jgi:hypothetical protein